VCWRSYCMTETSTLLSEEAEPDKPPIWNVSTFTLALVRLLIWIGSNVVDEKFGVVSSERLVPNGAMPNSTSGKSGDPCELSQAPRWNFQPMVRSLLTLTDCTVPPQFFASEPQRLLIRRMSPRLMYFLDMLVVSPTLPRGTPACYILTP